MRRVEGRARVGAGSHEGQEGSGAMLEFTLGVDTIVVSAGFARCTANTFLARSMAMALRPLD